MKFAKQNATQTVLLTDGDESALRLARQNATKNGVSNCKFLQSRWCDLPRRIVPNGITPRTKPLVVFGADVAYDDSSAIACAAVLDELLLVAKSTAVIALKRRGDGASFAQFVELLTRHQTQRHGASRSSITVRAIGQPTDKIYIITAVVL